MDMISNAAASDWRALDPAALNAGFDNSGAVSGSAAILADWEARSAIFRTQHGATLNMAYGSRERNRFDFFKAAEGGPTIAFIHGGFWQMRSKDTFSFAAAGPMARGINVAFLGYTLAPAATLDEMVAEIRIGLDCLAESLTKLGAHPTQLIVSGWSAGGHLAAMVMDHPKVAGCLAISGLYDLEPIRHTNLNIKLGLDAPAAARNSPLLRSVERQVPLCVVAGASELPLMRIQSAQYAAARAARFLPIQYEEIAGANHFTIMDAMVSPNGRITNLVSSLMI